MSNFNFLGNFLGKVSKFAKDGHDMSNREACSLPFGIIHPLKCVEVVPNEHYSVQVGGLLQTGALREDNFAEIFSNLKAVYVPMSSIWRDYLSFTQSSRDTRKDELFNSYNQFFPVFDLNTALRLIFPLYFYNQVLQAGLSVCPNLYDAYFDAVNGRIEDNEGNVLVDVGSIINTNKDPLVRQFCLLMLDASVSFKTSFLFEFLDSFKTQSGELICFDVLRIFDHLGYRNNFPFFDTLVYNTCKAFSNQAQLLHVVFTTGALVQPESIYWDRDGWLAWLSQDPQFSDLTNKQQMKSLLPLIAWQYYVYSCEVSNYRLPSTRLLSFDSIMQSEDTNQNCFNVSGNVGVLDIGDSDLDRLQQIVAISIDYSNSVIDYSRLVGNSLFVFLTSLRTPLLSPDIFTTMQNSVVSGGIPSAGQTININTIQAIADTSALYKIRQDLLRSGVRRDKQMAVMYGVSPSDVLTNDVFVLDKTSTQVKIQSLINQAASDVAPLGARGSRGEGGAYLDFKFDSKDFGFLFFVCNVTTNLYYENFACHRSHGLFASSWFNPRNNHLGLEAVLSQDISDFVGTDGSDFVFQNNSAVAGFSVRDWHLKQQVDLVHGYFTNFGFRMPSEQRSNNYVPFNLSRGNGIFGGFVPSLIEQQDERFASPEDLYYNPYMLNNLFVQQFDGSVHGDPTFDHFRCIFSFKIHKVSPMPKLGLIKLD